MQFPDIRTQVTTLQLTLLQLSLYPRIVCPVGVTSVPSPDWITNHEMTLRSQHNLKGKQGSLEIVYGLVDAFVTARIEKPDLGWQWDGATSKWKYLGSPLVLDLEIGIYVSDLIKGFLHKDDIFQLVMCHELKHWKDEMDIIKSLPDLVKNDEKISRYFDTGMTVGLFDKQYRRLFEETTTVDSRTVTYFQNDILEIWAPLHNAHGEERDSNAEYVEYNENLRYLKTRQPKKVKWPTV